MPLVNTNLVEQYNERTSNKSWREIFYWTALADLADAAHRIEFAYEKWLKTSQSSPAPDVVKWVSLYGYIRLRLRNWQLPITLSPQEIEEWRAGGYYVELEDFQEALGAVFSGFADVARHEPQLTVRLVQAQLEEKLEELDRLASLSLEHYTPHHMEWQIRKEFEELYNLKGNELDEAVQDNVLEGRFQKELNDFEKPFILRELLQSFAWGIQKFRLLLPTEYYPEYGLPNVELYEEINKINLPALLSKLETIDKKLKVILDHLASFGCYDLNQDYDPPEFWWRHWKKTSRKKS